MLSKSQSFYLLFGAVVTSIFMFFLLASQEDYSQKMTASALPFDVKFDQPSAPEEVPAPAQAPVVLTEEQKQDILDDIQEKLYIIKRETQQLIDEQNPKEIIKEEKKEDLPPEEVPEQKDEIQEVAEVNVPSSAGGGGAPTPAPIYPKISISEAQILPVNQRFIELYNGNSEEVDLTDWYLQRKDANDESWNSLISSTNFSGRKIPASGYLLISRELPNSDIPFDFALSSNNSLAFKNPNREISDQINWQDVAENTSWCFDFNVCSPTPKTANIVYTPLSAPDPEPMPTDTTPPEIVEYTIENTTIDLKFSEKVKYKISIELDGNIIVSWEGEATDPRAKTWDATGAAPGVYNIKVEMKDQAGNEATDTSKTITIDNSLPAS